MGISGGHRLDIMFLRLFAAGTRGGGQQYRDDASASSDTSEYFERDVVR
jgi:hypothetical protein